MRRQGRTLKPELGSDKGWSGGRGRGRAAGGRAGPVRAAPSLRSSGAKLCVNGGPGVGPGGPGGRGLPTSQWQRGAPGPRCRDWRSAGRGGAKGAREPSPDAGAERNTQRQKTRQARGKGRRRGDPPRDRGGAGKMTGGEKAGAAASEWGRSGSRRSGSEVRAAPRGGRALRRGLPGCSFQHSFLAVRRLQAPGVVPDARCAEHHPHLQQPVRQERWGVGGGRQGKVTQGVPADVRGPSDIQRTRETPVPGGDGIQSRGNCSHKMRGDRKMQVCLG